MIIFFILLLASGLRFLGLDQSLWLDESVNVMYAHNTEFWHYITKYTLGDFHPPGFFIILWPWIRLFGMSEISVRIPSIIFSLGTIYLTYLIGRDYVNKRVGLIAALLLAIAPLFMFYSQEARMYSMAAFGATCSLYGFISLLNKHRWGYLFYALGTVFLLYSDYVAYFILVPQFLYFMKASKEQKKEIIKGFSLGFLFFLPWLLIFPSQIVYGQQIASILTGWKDVVGGATLKNLLLLPAKIAIGRISIDSNILYVGTLLFVLGLYSILIFKAVSVIKKTHLFLVFLILPIMVGFLISFFIPIFSYFRFLFILPLLYLLLGVSLSNLKGKIAAIMLVICILIGIIPSAFYLINNNVHRENWRDAVAFIHMHYQPGDLVLVDSNEELAPFAYYNQGKIPVTSALVNIPAYNENNVAAISLDGIKRVFLFEYLIDVYDPTRQADKFLERNGFNLENGYNFRGIGLIKVYIKK